MGKKMKWRSKVTGVEIPFVADSWDDRQQYFVAFSFDKEYDTSRLVRLPYDEFVKAFERIEE